jgi:plastocyanin
MPAVRLVLVLAVLALAASAPAAAAPPKLVGTVGPGFTITLTKGGKKVTTLKAGTYVLVVRDRADSHDFHLRGPGLNKVVTGTPFVGTKTITLKLRKGAYSYQCDPHASIMHGAFRVT